jgi:hypothetical protein
MVITAIATIGLATVGCAPATMDLPAGFMEIEQPGGEYDVRAVSAEDVVVTMRSEDGGKEPTLAFWSRAIEKELTGRRGYTLTDTEDVISESGTPGVLMTFDVTQQATTMTYMAAVFIRGQKVIITESAGPADAVKPITADLRKALLSVR